MKIFLDTSVLLAASGSAAGAAREVFRRVPTNGWELIVTPYVIDELLRNLPQLGPSADRDWGLLRPLLSVKDDVFTLNRPAVFSASKDRPILFGALAWADILLTLDQRDFGELLNKQFYGLFVLKPGTFLERERSLNRLRK